MANEKQLSDITNAATESPPHKDGAPVLPAKPEPSGKVLDNDIGEPEAVLDSIQSQTFSSIDADLLRAVEGRPAAGGEEYRVIEPGKKLIGTYEQARESYDGGYKQGHADGIALAEAERGVTAGDNYGGSEWAGGMRIKDACANISDLAAAWAVTKGSKVRDEIVRALQAEADHLLKLQGERDGGEVVVKEVRLAPGQKLVHPGPVPPRMSDKGIANAEEVERSQKIARNGNKPGKGR